ncbi:MAG TPA: MarR family transcriptional regulator [Bacteroidia bacterium]|jgi:DNA-binding MarR family transcriptional regulator|nr:MarR family transcriptional regulator [Bacteroidia bacterium]
MAAQVKQNSIFDFEDFSYGRKFGMLGKLYLAELAKNLKHLEIEKQFSVLVLLDKMGSQCSQKLIGEMLHIDKAMMVGVIDDLSKKGFIKRAQNPNDRREYWVQLTEKGKTHMPEILSTVRRLNKSIMKGLTQTEVKKFHDQLETIYKNLYGSIPAGKDISK